MVADAPQTVIDALKQLEADGFTADFSLRDGVCCSACRHEHPPALAEVEQVFRFEGPSDPDEEAIVFAMRCPACGARGSLVSAFGPGADPEVMDRIVLLQERFQS